MYLEPGGILAHFLHKQVRVESLFSDKKQAKLLSKEAFIGTTCILRLCHEDFAELWPKLCKNYLQPT